MSERAVAFVKRWIADNLSSEAFLKDGNDRSSRVLPIASSADRSTTMSNGSAKRSAASRWMSVLAFAVAAAGVHLALNLAIRGGSPDARERKFAATSRSRSEEGRAASTPTQIPPRGWWEIARRTYEEMNRDRVQAVAAGVTFYSLLALFPALTALVSLYGLVSDPASIAGQLENLDTFLPTGTTAFLAEQIVHISTRNGATLGFAFFIGLGAALWGANAGVKALFDALNVAYGEDEKRGFFKLNAISLLFTAGIIGFLPIALGAIAVIPIMLDYVFLGSASEWLISIGRWPVLFVVLVISLGTLFRTQPRRCAVEMGKPRRFGRCGGLGARIGSFLLVRGEFRRL